MIDDQTGRQKESRQERLSAVYLSHLQPHLCFSLFSVFWKPVECPHYRKREIEGQVCSASVLCILSVSLHCSCLSQCVCARAILAVS